MTIDVTLAGRISAEFAIDVTFAIPAAGVTALLGPSGSGKTSLLRALAGLDRVPGRISFAGEIWQDQTIFVPPHKRRIGYVFQGQGLLHHLNVGANLDFAIRRAPMGRFALADVVARTGIAALLDRRPDRLSGGESQRASIARALLGQPRLLLMDEPLSALDADGRSGLLGELEALLQDFAVPTLYVTHDQAEAQRLAARTIYLRQGKVERISGEPITASSSGKMREQFPVKADNR